MRSYPENTQHKKKRETGRVAQVVEHLLRKCEAKPQYNQKKKRRKIKS
jgi:hypothetical protein